MAKDVEEIERLAVALTLEADSFQKQSALLNKQINALEREFKNASKGVTGFENTFTGLDAKFQKGTKQLDLYEKKLQSQNSAYDDLQKDLEASKKKLEEIESTVGKGSKGWKDQAQLVAKNADKLSKLGTDINKTEKNISRLNKELKDNEKAFYSSSKKVKTLEETLENIAISADLAESEFEKLGQELERSGTFFQKLRNETDILANKFDASKQKANAYEKEIANIKSTLEKSSKAHVDLNKSISSTEKELESAKNQYGNNSREANELKTKLAGLKDEYNSLESEIEQNENALKGYQTALNRTQTEVNSLDRELKTINFDRVGNGFKSAGASMQSFGSNMTTKVSMPLLLAAGAGIKLSSDMEESLNKVGATFEGNAKEIEKWSEDTLTNFGIAQSSALDYAATAGDILKGIGFEDTTIADMSKEIIGMSADIASFKNGKPEEVFSAITAALTGEREQLKKYGYVINDAILQEYALAQGMSKKLSEMTLQEKALLTLSKIQEYAKDATGDFAKTSDGSANSTRIFTESLKQLGTEFGEHLLPLFTELVQWLTKLVDMFSNLPDSVQKGIVMFGGMLIVLGPLISTLGSLSSIFGATLMSLNALQNLGGITGALGELSKSFGAVKLATRGVFKFISSTAIPALGQLAISFGLPALAIGGVVAAGVFLIKHWDDLCEMATALGDFIGDAWNGIWESIKNAANSIKETCEKVFTGLFDILMWPFRQAQNAIDGFFDGVGRIANKFNPFTKAIEVRGSVDPVGPIETYSDMSAFSTLDNLDTTMATIDYSSNRYNPSSVTGRDKKNSNSTKINETTEIQSNGLVLNIQTFVNNSKDDLEQLANELMYLMDKKSRALGGI